MQTDEEPLGIVGNEVVTMASTEALGGEGKSKKAFSKISRELSEDDLKAPGTQRLLLSEIDQYEECKAQLEKYRTLYFNSIADCRVLKEQLKSNAALEITTGSIIALGPALMTLAPSIVDKDGNWYYVSTIVLIIGLSLLIGGIITKMLTHKS